jgi:hypothetical protein
MGIQRSGRLENLKRRLMGPDAPIGHRPQALLHHLFLPALTVLRRCSSFSKPQRTRSKQRKACSPHTFLGSHRSAVRHYDSRERRRSGPIQPPTHQSISLLFFQRPSPAMLSPTHLHRALSLHRSPVQSGSLGRSHNAIPDHCPSTIYPLRFLFFVFSISKPPFQSVAKVCKYMMVFTSLCDTEGGCSGTDALGCLVFLS